MLPWAPATNPPVPDGRRERKKSRTHEDLVAAATQLFATHGYEETSIEQITELADVSPRTFFRHFASKEDVLFPTSLGTDELMAALEGQPNSASDLEAIRNAYVEILPVDDVGLDRALLLKKAVRSTPALEGRSLALQRQFRSQVAIAVGRRHGLDAPDDLAELVAALAEAVIHLVFDKWADSDGQADLGVLVIEQFELVDQILSRPVRPSGRRNGKKSATRTRR
jgi:AcrR family transcriptional regulator